MRKMLQYLLIGSLILGSALVVYAQTNIDTDEGYVIVRCTVTVDVDVLDEWATAWFVAKDNYNGLTPGQSYVSVTSITVRNLSSGAILKYAVLVSSIQRNTETNGSGAWISDDDNFAQGIKGWTLDSSSGVCRFVLRAVFANARPALGDFGTGNDDRFQVNLAGATPNITQRQDHTYKTNGEMFDPATSGLRYNSILGNSTGVNFIPPNPETGYERGLWFRIDTPTAVTDELPRRIIIRVDGGLGNVW